MRRGEILGLELGDIDFDNNTIDVNKSWISVNGKPQWSEVGTKTYSGNRLVAILPETTAWLKAMKKPNTKYFFQENGKLYDPLKFYQDYKKIVSSIGIDIIFYELQHNYATMMMTNNTHTSLIQGQLGQKDTKTTKKYYQNVKKPSNNRSELSQLL